MNELQVFNNEEFGSVRVHVDESGEPWFCGKDVLTALEYGTDGGATKYFLSVPEQWKGGKQISTPGGTQEMLCVSEQGLYFFLGRSDKPKALPYQMYIAGEVMPSIRKHGVYMTPVTIDNIIKDPDFGIRLLMELKEEQSKRKDLETVVAVQNQQIAELSPKASYYDVVLNCKDLVTISVIAKDYGMSAKEMNKKLRELGIQFKQGKVWLLYQKYAEMGLTQTKTYTYEGKDGTIHTKLLTCWNQRGRLYIYEAMKRIGILPVMERE